MKKIIIVIFLLISNCRLSFAQQSITGTWASSDGSRTYSLYQKDNSYEAILLTSKRTTDTSGKIILSNLKTIQKKKKYKGFIHAVDDGKVTGVKLTNSYNGTFLKLKLRRMFIFPVYIVWRKTA